MAGRNFNQAFHCISKHSNNAAMHLFETAEKFWREDPTNNIDSGTREELLRGQREIQAIEGHAGEILSKMPDDADQEVKEEVRDIGDTARRLRQEIQDTGVPFKANVEVSPQATEKVEDALGDIEELQERVHKFATEFEQEQLEEGCARCEEDLLNALEGNAEGLKTELINDIGEKDTTDQDMVYDQQFQNPEGELIPTNILGDNTMADTQQLKSLTVGAFGAKTLEEVANMAENRISELQAVQFGPLGFSEMFGLGVGLGVPALELATGAVSETVGRNNMLALNSAALMLAANEVGDLATTVAEGQLGGQARGATVRRTATVDNQDTQKQEQEDKPSGLVVGQGQEQPEPASTGLVVG